LNAVELRGLLDNKTRYIKISKDIETIFNLWKEKRDKIGYSLSELEIFYSGYVMANPIVREKYKELIDEKS
jgi:hypothetical protein